MDADGPLANSTLNIDKLGLLNQKIIEDELMDQAPEKSRGEQIPPCRIKALRR